MPRSGTLVICVQNLDFSGANQVVLNIIAGKMHESNVVVLSPKNGTFGARFVESGAAVRIGVLEDLLTGIRDVFCVICNTIMTANIVVEMSSSHSTIPIIWILHEWWTDEMIKENLKLRNYSTQQQKGGLSLSIIKQALTMATKVVCVCQSQRQLYNPPIHSSTVIYVGVPDPLVRKSAGQAMIHQDFTPPDEAPSRFSHSLRDSSIGQPFTFLCLGIVCPRKNQLWTIELFKKFAASKPPHSVRLQIVGARYTRIYEIEYLEHVKAAIGQENNSGIIELHDVTDHVASFYSVNEVTPMVISESLSWGIPVLSTNIAGVKEMFQDGVEGFMFDPEDEAKALQSMELLYSSYLQAKHNGDHDNVEQQPSPYQQMCKNARARYESMFDLDCMIEAYRQLVLEVAPPVILLDMDGTLVDWDKGFLNKWKRRCSVDRSKSYHMEECLGDRRYIRECQAICHAKGFFRDLEWMEGALSAIQEMEAAGLQLFIVTAPVQSSKYCAQEKIDWIRTHLGEKWLNKLILCTDKTTVAGDLLIDDKPYAYMFPGSKHTTATWRQIVFDAPYNRQMSCPRLCAWSQWKSIVYPMLGRLSASQLHQLSAIRDPKHPSPAALLEGMEEGWKKEELRISIQRDQLNNRKDTLYYYYHASSSPLLNPEMTLEELQRTMDMMHSCDTPLQMEDAATIISGSLSLLDNDDELNQLEEEKLIQSLQSQAEAEHGDNNDGDVTGDEQGAQHKQKKDQYLKQLLEKKKQLAHKLALVNLSYQQAKTSQERQAMMDMDSSEMEGVQLFQPSYQAWKSKSSQK